MNIIAIFVAFVFGVAFLCPSEKGSVLSLILADTFLPLRSVPLAACVLFLLAIGFFQGWDFSLYLAASLFVQVTISIAVGRKAASRE